MIKWAINFLKGVKGTVQLTESKPKQQNKYMTSTPKEEVDMCLNCTKPASKCKGDCFAKNKKIKDEN